MFCRNYAAVIYQHRLLLPITNCFGIDGTEPFLQLYFPELGISSVSEGLMDLIAIQLRAPLTPQKTPAVLA